MLLHSHERKNTHTLPTDYEVCKQRTRSMSRCLAKTPDLLKAYREITADQEKHEFIEKVQPTADSQNLHYKHCTKRKFPPKYIRINSKQMTRC